MSNKLNKVLSNILSEKKESKDRGKKSKKSIKDSGAIELQNLNMLGMPNNYQAEPSDIRIDLKDQESREMQMEPADKLAIQIQHMLINGDYEEASKIIKQQSMCFTKGMPRFSFHHLQLLTDWVRSIYKYTNMKDLSKNYYNYQDKLEVDGVKDLSKVKVKEETIDRFIKDVEKVLRKKLEPS